MSKIYEEYKKSGLKDKLFVDGMHNEKRHPMSKAIGKFLNKIDFCDFEDSLGLSFGGDGDNGEILLDELDAFFYTMDLQNGKSEE